MAVDLLLDTHCCTETPGFLVNELPQSMLGSSRIMGSAVSSVTGHLRNLIECAVATPRANEKQFLRGQPPR